MTFYKYPPESFQPFVVMDLDCVCGGEERRGEDQGMGFSLAPANIDFTASLIKIQNDFPFLIVLFMALPLLLCS